MVFFAKNSKNVDFRKLLTARFLFVIAVQIQTIVLGWHMYDITKDPLYLGFIGLAEALPALSFALPAGMFVDQHRPLRVYRFVLTVSLLSGLILLASQIPAAHFNHHLEIIALFACSFTTGFARAFNQPSVFAIMPRIVPRQNYSRYVAIMTTSMQSARIIGPALGGLLYAFIGVLGAAVVVCALLILAIGVAFLIRADIRASHTRTGSAVDDLFSGAKFVFRHKLLLPAMSLDMVSVFFGGVTALLPIYAAEILKVGPQGLGYLRAAPAVGAVIFGLALTRLEFRKNAGRWFFTAVAGFGVATLVFAVSRYYALSLGAMLFAGGFDSISMVIRSSTVQLSSPDHMRGRISAVNSIFIGSSNELGEFESGVAAKLLGVVPAAVFGGLVCLLTVGVTAAIAPALRALNLHELESEHQQKLSHS